MIKSCIKLGLFFLLVHLFSCKPDSVSNAQQEEHSDVSPSPSKNDKSIDHSSTQEMIAELSQIAMDKSDIESWHLNGERASQYDATFRQVQDVAQKLQLLFKSSDEWLKAGKYNESIRRMESLITTINKNKIGLPAKQFHDLKAFLGICYLRKGEIENCQANHNQFSCLLPIEKEGVHKNVDGSTAAKKIFLELLEKDPSDVQIKWLYNIAEMTLGNYPGNIKSEHLIPTEVFKSDAGIKRFTDISMGLGLGINDIAGGVIMEDFNNDYHLDLMVSSYGLDDQLRFFENDGNGNFTDKTSSAKLSGLVSGLNLLQADYNNDGYMDVLVLRGAWLGKQGTHPNSLLQNNGDGTFTDVTKKTGLYSKFPTQTATWADFNNDGWIDLFIGNESTKSISAPSQLYFNNGDGSFTDVAAQKGVDLSLFIKGCTSGDIDNDGDVDIYVSVIQGDNYLLENQGASANFTFKNIANSSGTSNPQRSFPCWMFDYNQDGFQDIFVSGFDFAQFKTAAGEVAKSYLGLKTEAELPIIFQNNQDGSFKNVTKQLGIGEPLFTMGCNYGDINNDGFLDFYAATGTPDFSALIPNKMFLNNNGNQFLDVTTAAGLGHLQKGHGVSIGDIDNDGDQDIYHVLGGSYDGDNFMNALFLNPNDDNNWIKIKLIGQEANRAAIGARLKIFAGSRIGYATVSSGGSFGANPLIVEKGLGQETHIDKIEITWPGSGIMQVVEDLKSNACYQITENKDPVEIDLIPIKLNTTSHHHHH